MKPQGSVFPVAGNPCCCDASDYFVQRATATRGTVATDHLGPAPVSWTDSHFWLEREFRMLPLDMAQPSSGYDNFIFQLPARGFFGAVRLVRNGSNTVNRYMPRFSGGTVTRVATGTAGARSRHLSLADGDFTATAFDPDRPNDDGAIKLWTSPRSNVSYALWWRIRIEGCPVDGGAPAAALEFDAWPQWEDQELSTKFFSGLLNFPFWEGVVEPRNATLVWKDGRREPADGLTVFCEHVSYPDKPAAGLQQHPLHGLRK